MVQVLSRNPRRHFAAAGKEMSHDRTGNDDFAFFTELSFLEESVGYAEGFSAGAAS
jgi:hypothetical protein